MVVAMIVIVTNFRSLTTTASQGMPTMAEILGAQPVAKASNIKGPFFLSKDELVPTVFAFQQMDEWKYGTLLLGPLFKPAYALASLVGYDGLTPASTGLYGINNYNGIWLGRGPGYTNHSSSPVAEGYVNGGSIGVLLYGVLGGVLVGYAGRLLGRAWRQAGHGDPGERHRLRKTALWVPIAVNVSLIIAANVAMGSPGSIVSPILLGVGPVWMLYAFGRFVLPAIAPRR